MLGIKMTEKYVMNQVLKAPVFFILIYLIIIFLSLYDTSMDHLSIALLSYMLYVFVTLYLGWFLARKMFPVIKFTPVFYFRNINIIDFLMWCLIFNVIFSLINYVGVMGWTLDLSTYRQYLTVNVNHPLIINFSSIFNFATYVIIPMIIFTRAKISKFRLLIILLSIISLGILSTSRSFFIILSIFILLNYVLTYGIKLKYILVCFIFILAIFFIIPYFTGKNYSIDSFMIYLLGGIHALDKIINGVVPDLSYHGYYSFSFIAAIFSKFGLSDPRPLLDYIYVPAPTNVYTMLGVYFLDFGYYGSLIVISLIGFISGIIDKNYELHKTPRSVYLKSWNLTVLSLSFFYDYYTCSTIFIVLLCFSTLVNNKENMCVE
ncbi:hypothetical protein CGC45_01795 [Francisella opportunistica]|nr:hypothetical protein CGC45_01795 [Francisella opportunistica]